MKAITATGKIDRSGQLSLDVPIQETLPKQVRVIILFEETEEATQLWEKICEHQHSKLISSQKLQQELKQEFTELGYDSREKIVQLVQDIKQEIYQERKESQM